MRTIKYLLITGAVAVLSACGAVAEDSGTEAALDSNKVAARIDLPASSPASATVAFGGDTKFANSVTVSISTPKPFQPSTNAYPQCARAAAFDIAIRNNGTQPYRLSGFAVHASIDGAPVKQVMDSAQGYVGIVDAGKDIAPTRSARFSLAFALPGDPVQLRLTVRPDTTNTGTALFEGAA